MGCWLLLLAAGWVWVLTWVLELGGCQYQYQTANCQLPKAKGSLFVSTKGTIQLDDNGWKMADASRRGLRDGNAGGPV